MVTNREEAAELLLKENKQQANCVYNLCALLRYIRASEVVFEGDLNSSTFNLILGSLVQ